MQPFLDLRLTLALIYVFSGCAAGFSQSRSNQSPAPTASQAGCPVCTATPSPTPTPDVKILYTGRLMGYFREPNWQSPDDTNNCPVDSKEPNSDERRAKSLSAEAFDKALLNADSASVLVGTGDNFAPELAAREFCFDPVTSVPADVKLPPGRRVGKDLFVWKPSSSENGPKGAWVPNEVVKTDPALQQLLQQGRGFIPTDNVATFFSNRGYSALLPGKHDFYFGPEHLRQLARLLASSTALGPKGPSQDKGKTFVARHGKLVQMLGANIVIETSWKDDHAPLTDTERPPTFVPRFPRAAELTTFKDLDIDLSGLKDGDTVYPWFVGPKVTFSRKSPQDVADIIAKNEKGPNALQPSERFMGLRDSLKKMQVEQAPNKEAPTFEQTRILINLLGQSDPRLCLVPRPRSDKDFDNPKNNDEDPKYFTGAQHCRPLGWLPEIKDEKLVLSLDFPWLDQNSKNATLLAGERYRLCFSANKGTFCIRFSTYLPLFQSSWAQQDHGTAQDCKDENQNCTHRNPMALCHDEKDCVYHSQHDPAPYALIEGAQDSTGTKDIAIFGVVDPHLGDTIGMLNLAWNNDNDGQRHFKTQVAFKDPGEAIQQLSDYFDRKYREEHEKIEDQKFKGIRMLLAQMSPQQAQALANRSGKFHVVVSAADQEMANLATFNADWTALEPIPAPDAIKKPEQDEAKTPHPHPQYLAVPYPHYVKQKGAASEWIADIGSLQITLPKPKDATPPQTTLPNPAEAWKSTSVHLRERAAIKVTPLQQDQWFADSLLPSANHQCLPRGFKPPVTPTNDVELEQQRLDYLQTMTLCAMQIETEADIAMLQKRDIFADLPDYVDHLALSHRRTQEILDRIIWKGDFLQLIYVPGSALKKVLEQSKAFDAEDKSLLSLADERNRGLLTLGVSFDPDRKEYAINGQALDPNKLYSVATSEYIAMGDTGYPDFASSQVKPPLVPRDIGKTFATISSVVCRHLPHGQNCLPALNGDDYFDESASLPDDPRIGKTSPRQLEIWSVFHRPGKVPGSGAPAAATVSTAASTVVSNRALWDFNLTKWSLGLTRMAHTGNNFDVNALFGGLTSSEASTVSSTTWTSDFAAQWSRSWRRSQIFVSPGYTYNVQHKGKPDDLDQVTQNANRGSLETGYAMTFDDRQPEHRDFLITARFETPLVTSFNRIKLKTTHIGEDGKDINDLLPMHLDRSYTLLLRPGFRWKRRVSSLEFGPEWAHEWKALTGINFLNTAGLLQCSARVTKSVADCASDAFLKAKAEGKKDPITSDSIVFTDRNNQDHTGLYWKINMTVPFHRRVSYVLTDAGDFFPVRYFTENSTTTLLRDYSQHQLKIDIFPSISVGPELDALIYRNKAVANFNGHFLFQYQILMKAQWNFDLFNWRDKRKQLIYAPPSSK